MICSILAESEIQAIELALINGHTSYGTKFKTVRSIELAMKKSYKELFTVKFKTNRE